MHDQFLSIFFFVLIFLLVISALKHYCNKSIISGSVWLLIGGLFYGFLNKNRGLGLPLFPFDPESMFYIFLPILIFNSSRKLNLKTLRSVGFESGFFATFGVVVTAILIAIPFSWITGVSFTHGFLFGAILAATDPVSVDTVLQKFRFSKKLKTLIEGESLLNDGTGIILFLLISGIIFQGKELSASSAILSLVWSIGGAIILGLVLGRLTWGLLEFWHDLHNYFIGAVIPVVMVYLSFGVAEKFVHVSGIITIMVATLTLMSLHDAHEHEYEKCIFCDDYLNTFWEFLGELAVSFLFFRLGMLIGTHTFGLPLQWAFFIIFVLLVARSIVVYSGSGVLALFGKKIPFKWQNILNLAGVKGGIAVALALMLPINYENRETMICATFAVIFFSTVVTPLVLNYYLKRIKL